MQFANIGRLLLVLSHFGLGFSLCWDHYLLNFSCFRNFEHPFVLLCCLVLILVSPKLVTFADFDKLNKHRYFYFTKEAYIINRCIINTTYLHVRVCIQKCRKYAIIWKRRQTLTNITTTGKLYLFLFLRATMTIISIRTAHRIPKATVDGK